MENLSEVQMELVPDGVKLREFRSFIAFLLKLKKNKIERQKSLVHHGLVFITSHKYGTTQSVHLSYFVQLPFNELSGVEFTPSLMLFLLPHSQSVLFHFIFSTTTIITAMWLLACHLPVPLEVIAVAIVVVIIVFTFLLSFCRLDFTSVRFCVELCEYGLKLCSVFAVLLICFMFELWCASDWNDDKSDAHNERTKAIPESETLT